VRQRVIHLVLPLLFSTLPVLAAVLIAATLPPDARAFYLEHISPLDYVILGLGTGLFLVQVYLAYHALRWRETSFDERPDPWLNRLAQASEWFPLLGLIGTVAAILQTFSQVAPGTSPGSIIRLYAPALTATGSGLFMSLLNILPAWVVIIGRGLILTLGGETAEE
jgi:hypothetical protein